MGCSVGYPQKPCPFGNEKPCTRENCSACVNFIPPKFMLRWCSLYDRDKVICQLPKKECKNCAFKFEHGPGRPARVDSTVDWGDPASVAKYRKEWGEKHKSHLQVAMDKFLTRNPNYMKNYYERNKERLKRTRQLKRENSRQQSEAKVQPDPRGSGSERDKNLQAK